MCNSADGSETIAPDQGKDHQLEHLLEQARRIAAAPEVRRTAAGFVGYGSTHNGDRVLLAVDSQTDYAIADAVATVLRQEGASVDVVVAQTEPDREFDDMDEIRVAMRREPWEENPRRWEGLPWVEELAARGRYDLLIHGKGGAIPKVEYRYEGFPWVTAEHFLSEANVYPRELHRLINERTWARILDNAGAKLHLSDPEGTTLSLTILEKPFYDGRHDYGPTPKWGHLMAHPPTPIEPNDDSAGVIAGTTSHFCRPFPRMEIAIEKARMVSSSGGGAYGDGWRELEEETKSVQYPCFPGPGLFWLWELAIGTNPKISRPHNIDMLSSGGFEWERRRAGIIHCGMGTRWRGAEERWAGEQGLLYGHLHVHLNWPTLIVETGTGVLPVIESGRLSAFDDAEVRDLASKFGDPDELLHDDWQPQIPGINCDGTYEEYSRRPADWVYAGSV